MSRFRTEMRWQLTAATTLHFEAADSRSQSSEINRLDLRQAFLETHFRENWVFRAGRQGLPLGDERLVGLDAFWNPNPQVFDGVSIRRERPGGTLGAFSALRVPISPTGFDAPSRRNLLTGLYYEFASENATVMPYILHASDQEGRHLPTAGVRLAGPWREAFDYNLEVAVQPRGAYAAHAEIGRTWKVRAGEARGWGEYNLASGGSSMFNDLYPAAYNSLGLQDPVGWRDAEFAGAGLGFKNRRFNFTASYRRLWKRAGRFHLGDQWLAGAQWHVNRHVTFAGGAETYTREGEHWCDLHPPLKAQPFAAVFFRF